MRACWRQVLLEFPCELVSAVVAGRWAASASPCRPWMAGYRVRLVMAAAVTAIVRAIPLSSAPCLAWIGPLSVLPSWHAGGERERRPTCQVSSHLPVQQGLRGQTELLHLKPVAAAARQVWDSLTFCDRL